MDIHLLKVRSFSANKDIPRILSLRAAVEATDQEGIEISEQALRAQLILPGHNPVHDRWVIASPSDPEALIGSALIRQAPGKSSADANILVHPDWRRLRVGTLLLSKVIERASEINAQKIGILANSRHEAATAFLKYHGFERQGAYTELRLNPEVTLPPVIWPYGYNPCTYTEIQNVSVLTEAMNLSYIPLWGHQSVSEQEMTSWLPEFNPQGLFLVFSEKGRVIGISRTEPSPERTQKNGQPTGYIDAPGIVPQHRRLDLYRALVLTGIRWLRDQGQKIIEMESWGDKLEVLKMYRELGFKDIRQLVSYEKGLDGA